MRNQFIYTTKISVTEEGSDAPIEKTIQNSFNVDMVTRTVGQEDGTLLVLLDDLHERNEVMPKMKNGKVSYIKERATFQSEIRLSLDDSKRFLELTDISINPDE